MQLLILGGTVFLGRHLVDAARERGHTVTLFNRGRHSTHVPPEIEQLVGDRDGDMSALHERRWDAVIDTSGNVPRIVRASAELLADAVEHYTFISSLSVYAEPIAVGSDEGAALGTLADETVEEVTGESYGPLKVLCGIARLNTGDSPWLNRRPTRSLGSLYLLAAPRCARWRGACTGHFRKSGAIHRRARPGGVDGAYGRTACGGHLQR